MKNFLFRLVDAVPIVGGVLVILTLFASGSLRTQPPSPSVFLVQPGSNGVNLSLVSTNLGMNRLAAAPSGKTNWPLLAIAVVGTVLLGAQTWANFNKQRYDPTLAMKYLDIFCENHLVEQRKKACGYYLKNKEWSIEVEDILDVLDDLGFYVQTIHVSREVLHQYFYWWIRGYVVLADSYIKSKQEGDPKRNAPPDPTRWEHCKVLLDEVSKVEAQRLAAVNAPDRRVDWSKDQKMRFLTEEADLDNEPGKGEHA